MSEDKELKDKDLEDVTGGKLTTKHTLNEDDPANFRTKKFDGDVDKRG